MISLKVINPKFFTDGLLSARHREEPVGVMPDERPNE